MLFLTIYLAIQLPAEVVIVDQVHFTIDVHGAHGSSVFK